jgi:hypothetical protein
MHLFGILLFAMHLFGILLFVMRCFLLTVPTVTVTEIVRVAFRAHIGRGARPDFLFLRLFSDSGSRNVAPFSPPPFMLAADTSKILGKTS